MKFELVQESPARSAGETTKDDYIPIEHGGGYIH